MKHAIALAALFAAAGCDSGNTTSVGGGGDSGADTDADTDSDSDADSDSDSDADSDTDTDTGSAAPECGNGDVEGDEACDDGNQASGDGCNSTCTLIDDWDYPASASTEGDQKEPALACSGDRAVLAFSDWSGVDGSGAAVRLRLFGADGLPVENGGGTDEEITVDTETAGHQSEPRLAIQSDDTIVVVWTDRSQSALNGLDARGRVLAGDGTSTTDDFALSSSLDGDQASPVVAAADDGTFMAVWVDDGPDGGDSDGFGIAGRLFYADGTPRINAQTLDTGSFRINQIAAGNQIQPDAAWIGDRYLIVWADASGQLDDSGWGIVGTALSTDGAFLDPGSDTLLSTTTEGLQASPRIAAQSGLGAVVCWTDDSQTDDVSHHGVRARLVDSELAGRTNGVTGDADDFQVNTTTAAGQQMPSPAADGDGGFVVTWHDWSAEDGSGAGIRARAFSSSGEPLVTDLSPEGDDFPVNTTFWDAQITPCACAVSGWFLSAWEDQSGIAPDESGSGLRFRLLPGLAED